MWPVVSTGPFIGQHSPVNKGGDRQCRPSNGENHRVVRAGRHWGGSPMALPDAESCVTCREVDEAGCRATWPDVGGRGAAERGAARLLRAELSPCLLVVLLA